jgi:hypothetical protein
MNPTDKMWSAFVRLEEEVEAGNSTGRLLELCSALGAELNHVEDKLLDAVEEARPKAQEPSQVQLDLWLSTLAIARAEWCRVMRRAERVDLEQLSEFLEQFKPS